MDFLGDERDDILGAGGTFDVHKDCGPTLSLEPAGKFSHDAGFSDAALACEQQVISLLDKLGKRVELGGTVKEIFCDNPATCGQPHRSGDSWIW